MRTLAWVAVLSGLLAVPALAEDAGYGRLDFSRMTSAQEAFFWSRLRSLAVQEAVLAYCDEADDFARTARQGIQACVTQAALAKAESFFRSELKTAEAALHERKAACRAKPAANQGWLGVELASSTKGALVAAAVANSPAATADLRAGDVIDAVDGAAIAGPKALSAKIRAAAPGATVSLDVSRDGVARKAQVKLGAMAFDADGRAALDMPALRVSSRRDLQAVAAEVASMCQSCKSSIWGLFCR